MILSTVAAGDGTRAMQRDARKRCEFGISDRDPRLGNSKAWEVRPEFVRYTYERRLPLMIWGGWRETLPETKSSNLEGKWWDATSDMDSLLGSLGCAGSRRQFKASKKL